MLTPSANYRGLLASRRSRAVLAVAVVIATALGGASAHAQDGYAADMKAGRAAYNLNDMATAQRHFDAALKAAENERQKGSAIYALGVVAQKQNKLPEAKQRAEQALAINPQDKQAKGLLDELSAPPAAAKKPAAKGLAKTPLAPGNTALGSKAPAAAQGTPVAKSASKPLPATGQPASPQSASPKPAAGAGPAAAAATPGETPPMPKVAKPAPKQSAKPAGAQSPAKDGVAKPAGVPAAAKKLPAAKDAPSGDPDVTPAVPPATGSVPRKSSEVIEAPAQPNPPLSAATPAISPSMEVAKPVAVLAAPDHFSTGPTPATQMTAYVTTAAPLTTGSIAAATPASLQTSAMPADEKPLPARARYVEMVCGVDYRQDGRQFVRAFEITHAGAKAGGDQAEILAFDLACERAPGGGHVPRTVLRGEDTEIVKTSLRRAQDGGWSYGHHRTHRQVRVRIEGDVLTLVPSAAEVAVLRKKLADNPAQLDALSAEARHNFELAVAGEGFPEFRLVRPADGLDAAFDQAAKGAKRLDDIATRARRP